MNIIYVGHLQEKSNSFARFKTLGMMGHSVFPVDIDSWLFTGHPVWDRTHHFLNFGPGIYRLGKEVLRLNRQVQADLIWMDNKPFIPAGCLRRIRQESNTRLIAVITDDAFGKAKDGWQILKKTMPLYDFHFVQRTVNIAEYQALGANQVLECDRSFDPTRHFPVVLSDGDQNKYGSEVGFIGTYAPHRARVLAGLIRKGIPVSVWGNDWSGKPEWQIIEPAYRGAAVYGETYRKVLSGMKIALHFLRKENRDDQDSRTFEIPACGAFMLAERTPKHQRYFAEGKEAEFFGSEEELEQKIRYYLDHPEKRQEIAAAGRKRMEAGDCSHEGRLNQILSAVTLFEKTR